MKADKMKELKESLDPTEFTQRISEQLYFKNHIFKILSYQEVYNNENKIRHRVLNLVPRNPKKEINNLIEKI